MQSLLKNSVDLTDHVWLLAIVRKSTSHKSEHAFLIVEGKFKKKRLFRRYDFVNGERKLDAGAIEIKERVWFADDILGGRSMLYDVILKSDSVYFMDWQIARQKADALHQQVILEQTNPPNYFISGSESISGHSLSFRGHNCFTWARKKVNNVVDRDVHIPVKLKDFIAAVPRNYIGPSSPKISTFFNRFFLCCLKQRQLSSKKNNLLSEKTPLKEPSLK